MALRETKADAAQTMLAAVDELCCAYSCVPPAALLPRVVATTRGLAELVGAERSPALRRDLLVGFGQTLLLASCLEQDRGAEGRATALAHSAARIGQESGHAPIIAWSHEIEAWQAVSKGAYRNAVAIARDAADLAPHSHVAVQLHMQQAHAHAGMGNIQSARTAFGRAERVLESLPVPSRPEHHFIFDRSKFSYYGVRVFDAANDDRGVAEWAQDCYVLSYDANGQTLFPMRIASIQLALARLTARGGALDLAVDYGLRALSHKRESVLTILGSARDLDRMLYQRWSGERDSRRFRLELRMLERRFRTGPARRA
jgi:tetratricopeptide (TPR) repeat protein